MGFFLEWGVFSLYVALIFVSPISLYIHVCHTVTMAVFCDISNVGMSSLLFLTAILINRCTDLHVKTYLYVAF